MLIRRKSVGEYLEYCYKRNNYMPSSGIARSSSRKISSLLRNRQTDFPNGCASLLPHQYQTAMGTQSKMALCTEKWSLPGAEQAVALTLIF